MIGLLGQPEGMAAKYDLTVEAAGPPLPSREAHVGFSKIFFFFFGLFQILLVMFCSCCLALEGSSTSHADLP